MSDSESGLGTWAIIELFGHRQIAGYCTEEQVAGAQMLKVAVPEIVTEHRQQDAFERFYSPGAIYSISPCTEELARRVVDHYEPSAAPVYLPAEPLLIPAGTVDGVDPEESELW